MTTAPSATVTLLSAGLLACSATGFGLHGAEAGAHPATAGEHPASGDGIQQALTNQLVNTLSLSPNVDVATIASVKFFVTADGGKTWSLGQQTAVPPGAKERPRFQLSVAHDGAYGIMTSVAYRQGKAAEPDPKPGQPPLYVVVVDTTPPVVARFEAALVSAGAERATVRCAWSTTDLHPASEPVALEVSADAGQHFTTVRRGPAAGEADIDVPLTAGVKQLQVRLGAIDLAKNAVATPVKLIDLSKPAPVAAPAPTPPIATAPAAATATPQPAQPAPAQPALPVSTTAPASTPAPAPTSAPATPADPLAEFAQAAKTLPLASDFGIGPPPVLPEIPPVAQDQPAKHAPAPAKAADTAPAPKSEPAPTAASVKPPVKAADVVVQGAPAPTIGDDRPLAGSNALDQEFYRKLAELHPGPAPARQTARPVARESTADADDREAAPAPRPAPARPADHAAPAAPTAAAAGAAAARSADGQRQRPDPAGFLDASTALQTLADARIAVLGGRIDEACDAYERLRASSIAKAAALEESHILLREQRPRDALTAIESLPPELVTDGVRLDQGRALLALGRPDAAFAALTRIGGSAPESRPALLLIARCYRAKGNDAEARKLLEFLGRGGDQVAAEAAAEAAGGKR